MAALVECVRDMKRAMHDYMPDLFRQIDSAIALHPRYDSLREDKADFEGLRNRLRLSFGTPVRIKKLAEDNLNNAKKFNLEQFRRVVKSSIGVDPVVNEPWLSTVMESAVTENVSLISSIPDKTIGEVESMVSQAQRRGTRAADLAEQIMERFDVAESRARLIARDQISKLNADLTQARQQEIGAKEYVWRTSQDERVRESHREKEGKTFRWDDPPSDTGHPGEDINCRCYAEMVIPDDLLS